MRFHGLVTLASLMVAPTLFAQDYIPSQSFIPSSPMQAAPELNAVPLPAVPLPSPPASAIPSRSSSFNNAGETLEGELDALRSDLRSFHSLSEEVARNARAAEADADRTMIRQRQEMLDILTKLATQGLTKKVEQPQRPKLVLSTKPEEIVVPPVTDSAVDQFALGKSLFRAGEYVKAEQAFRKVAVGDDNRLMVKYLIATCLRKRSQWKGAVEAYREVAASDKDPVLRDLANFQLDGIRWNQETELQIEQLRKQRERQLIPSKNQP
jgi:tetratricopeptide (TPR) repeat protein